MDDGGGMLQSRLAQLALVLNALNSPPEKLLLALDEKNLAEFGYIVLWSKWFCISCDVMWSIRKLLETDTSLSNVVMDTGEHDRMSILCIACEMVSLVTMENWWPIL